MEEVFTIYHECGHAIAAMCFGAEGWINVRGTKGQVEIEAHHIPDGRENVIYGYAGAVAEAMFRLDGRVDLDPSAPPFGLICTIHQAFQTWKALAVSSKRKPNFETR